MATAEQTLSWVKDLFENGGCYEREHEVDENENAILTEMSLQNKLKSTKILIECHEVYISVRAHVNICVDEERRQSVAEYITRVNSENPFCSINMILDNGAIWSQTALICQGMVEFPLEAFIRTFYSTANMLERYGDGLLEVMFGIKSPEEVIDDIWSESGCCCGHDHEDIDCPSTPVNDAYSY